MARLQSAVILLAGVIFLSSELECRPPNGKKTTTTTTPVPTFSLQTLPPGKGDGGAGTLVVDGVDADMGSWHFLISLQFYDDYYQEFDHVCGAVLIDTQYAVTAAHCVDNSVHTGIGNPGYLRVALAEHNLITAANEEYINVIAIYSHGSFALDITAGFPNDISVLKLARAASVSRTDIGLITMAAAGESFSGSSCYTLGWGFTSPGGYHADTLQQAAVSVIDKTSCQSQLAYPVLSSHICTGGDGGPLPCDGDSGGPLVCVKNNQPILAGIASWNYLCNQSFPSVYTRVSHFLAWIQAQKI